MKIILLALFLVGLAADARPVTLAWDPNPESENITGYYVWRMDTVSVAATVPVGTTTATIEASTGERFAVTAFRSSDQTQSEYSNIVTVPEYYTVPPESDTWALVQVTSQYPAFPATNAFDKNPASFWATNYENTAEQLPQTIVLDMGKPRSIKGWSYLPRQDGHPNGHLENWRISFSLDNQVWTPPINGSFSANTPALKTVLWASIINARFLKLECLSAIGIGTWHVVIAEIDVIEAPPLSAPTGLRIPLK